MFASPQGAGHVVGAVVVAFNPGDGFSDRLHAVRSQVAQVVVVDNSESGDRIRAVEAACRAAGCELRAMGSNVGVAEALNVGVRALSEAGATAVLTLDQDSVVSPGMVAALLDTLHSAERSGLRVGLVVPHATDQVTGRTTAGGSAASWSKIVLAITSGSLVPLPVFREVGMFRTDFFIDGIDQEFCLRLLREGYSVVQSHRALLIHNLGSPRVHRVLRRDFIPTNHSAQRRYFMARNLVWTSKLFFASESAVVLRLLVRLAKNVVLIAALEEQKLDKLAATASGLVAGLRTRPAPPPRLA